MRRPRLPAVWIVAGLGAWVGAVSIAAPTQAQIHFDVSFQQNESDGRLSIHGRDFDQLPANRLVFGQRVFGRSVEIAGNSLVQNDPGFTASDNDVEIDPFGLDPPVSNENLRFDILAAPASLSELGGRNLSYWDGNGSVSWGAVPDTEGVEISAFSNSAIADGGPDSVPGFVIAATDSEGGLHRHIAFRLLPDNGALPPSGPDDGVYLMLLAGTLEPYAESVPFYLMYEVFAGGQATIDAAIADVEADLLFPLCSDGIDNDGDGLIDAPHDPGCVDGNDMSERGAIEECDNGVDDDLDGFVDFPNDDSCVDAFGVVELPEPGLAISLLVGAPLLALLDRRRRRRT